MIIKIGRSSGSTARTLLLNDHHQNFALYNKKCQIIEDHSKTTQRNFYPVQGTGQACLVESSSREARVHATLYYTSTWLHECYCRGTSQWLCLTFPPVFFLFHLPRYLPSPPPTRENKQSVSLLSLDRWDCLLNDRRMDPRRQTVSIPQSPLLVRPGMANLRSESGIWPRLISKRAISILEKRRWSSLGVYHYFPRDYSVVASSFKPSSLVE